jgi:glycosyltransferase involved in cell wall biosynthesis
MTAFHLDSYRRKNARRLIVAARELGAQIDGVDLSIVGRGTPQSVHKIEGLIAARQSPVRLEGAVPHDAMQQRMNSAGGFVLVSNRESFGMVFVEALLAGCPIVYPEGRAIAGHFDDCPFAIAASPRSQNSITEAMGKMAADESRLKSALAEWQRGPGPRHFQRAAIAENYVSAMDVAIDRADSVSRPESRVDSLLGQASEA